MKTIRPIKIPDNYYVVLRELARLHGQTIEEFCAETIKCQLEDTIENNSEDIGRLVCNPWKKLLKGESK